MSSKDFTSVLEPIRVLLWALAPLHILRVLLWSALSGSRFSYRIQGSHISEKYGLPNPVLQCQRDNIQVLALILSLVFRGQSFYTRGHHSMHWVVDQCTCVRIDGGERGRYCRSPLWEHPRTVPTRISQVPTASRPYRLPLFQCLALTIKILRGLMP